MSGYLDWFIPSEDRKDPEQSRKARQFIILNHIAVVFLMINLVKWYKMGVGSLAVSLACVISLLILSTLIMKFIRTYSTMAHVTMGLLAWHFLYLPFNTGGIFSSALQWNIVLPGMAFAFMGVGSAVFWSILMIAVIGIFAVLANSGIDFNTVTFTKEQLFQAQIANTFGPLLVLGFVFFFNQKSLDTALNRQADAVRVAEKLAGEQMRDKEHLKEMAERSGQILEDVGSHTESLSSSAAQIASMANRNAESALAADDLMRQSEQVVSKANHSMGSLTESMHGIADSSSRMSRIIRTIDEIAFQTNLLALNAAIEAARAGEAGAGFAVVAGEVRNLAVRSAESARNTSELIESTMNMVASGESVLEETNSGFRQVSEQVAKAGVLIREISAGTEEQREGAAGIHQAVEDLRGLVRKS